MTSVTESYRICVQLAYCAASNFYYTFYLLPRSKRLAMCAVYAYLRELDDLADAPVSVNHCSSLETLADDRSSFDSSLFDLKDQNFSSEQRIRLNRLQLAHDQFHKALCGEAEGLILPALVDTIQKFSIPADYFVEVMRGMAMDVIGKGYSTWDDLQKYCYRVASVVGLICLHIWDVKDARAHEPAIACGNAFQLTNILRDIGDDARIGRIYLPQDDLQSHGYSREGLYWRRNNDSFRNLIKYEIDRAKSYYNHAAALRNYLSADAVRMFAAMFCTYRELLDMIEHDVDQLYVRRMRVSRWRKAVIAGRALVLGGKSI